ncbi:hypothetical protein [Acrocarpospora sp. B8E8]|uniref:hypothetical protein n=1 Tax=Acrocarpospora sp. B8E8 TaxID=3153572 RepID=UPI00325F986D
MGVSVRLLAELAASQWLGVETGSHEIDDRTQVTVSVPGELSDEERERFVRIAEDMARHFVD